MSSGPSGLGPEGPRLLVVIMTRYCSEHSQKSYFTWQAERVKLTERIQEAGTEVVKG